MTPIRNPEELEAVVPAHRRDFARGRRELARGYAWGRQDAEGQANNAEATAFADYAYAEALAYVAEVVYHLPAIKDQWSLFKKEYDA